jgi:hypothetical protein
VRVLCYLLGALLVVEGVDNHWGTPNAAICAGALMIALAAWDSIRNPTK